MYAQEPFQKQINRKQAVLGKLLEDLSMTRMLIGVEGTNDLIYHPNETVQSHSKALGHVRTFTSQVGRLDMHRSGTRAAADGTYPSHWFPHAPPKDGITKPAGKSCGIKFEKQITRKQDVNGKLLEDIQMTRFLFGANMVQGPEFYDKAYDTMLEPGTSPRNNSAQFCAILRNSLTPLLTSLQGSASSGSAMMAGGAGKGGRRGGGRSRRPRVCRAQGSWRNCPRGGVRGRAVRRTPSEQILSRRRDRRGV